ncbi:MAG: nuclear transport factor 2 family protein [Bryobacteraceae bacterium]
MGSTAIARTAEMTGSYVSEYDEIVRVLELYNEGVRRGSSALMKSAFHESATFFGYYEGKLLAGPIQLLFDWVDSNGPASEMQVRVASVDIHQTIAVLRLEMENVRGKLAGQTGCTLSDLFQLIKIDGAWKISQKSFHWHTA